MGAVEIDALQAGRTAFERHDWERAYELLSAADSDVSLDGADLERLAEAAAWSRRFGRMLELLERAESAYCASGERRGAARVALKLAREYYQRQNLAQAAGWLGRARTLLGAEDRSRESGLLRWMELHATFFETGDVDAAIPMAESLIDHARTLGDSALEALGLLELGHALIISGRVADGSRLLDEANALAGAETVELEVTGTVYCSTIFACRNIGDWRRAAEWTERSLGWCERNAVSGFPGLCRLHRAEVIRFGGSLEEAERDARAACEELLESYPLMAGHAFHELGEVQRRRGDFAGAEESFTRALELGFDPQPGLALLRLQLGDAAGAARAIARRLSDRDAFAREGRILLLPAQVTAALAAGEPDDAAAAARELEQLSAAYGTAMVATSGAQARGELALARGRLDVATAELRAAWRGWCELRAPYEAANTRVLLGRAYELAGDLRSAKLEYEGAGKAFAEIGAVADAEHARSRLSSLPEQGGTRTMRTFMFTDIVDSTRLLEVLGDDAWGLLLAWHDRALRACFAVHQGSEIKHEGDGFFVAFRGADDAVRCATDIQRQMQEHRRLNGFAPQIRIGLHTAEATSRGDDYIGQAVHTASRVAATGGPGEIIASAGTVEATTEPIEIAEERVASLKGLTTPLKLARLSWG